MKVRTGDKKLLPELRLSASFSSRGSNGGLRSRSVTSVRFITTSKVIWAQLTDREGLHEGSQAAIFNSDISKLEFASQPCTSPVQSLDHERGSAVQMIIEPLIKSALSPDCSPDVRHSALRVVNDVNAVLVGSGQSLAARRKAPHA